MEYSYVGARREVTRLRKFGHKRAHVVQTRRWSMDLWKWVPCWTVVLR